MEKFERVKEKITINDVEVNAQIVALAPSNAIRQNYKINGYKIFLVPKIGGQSRHVAVKIKADFLQLRFNKKRQKRGIAILHNCREKIHRERWENSLWDWLND